MNESTYSDALEDAPSNWNKWGDEDEVGAVNYLDNEEVLRGIQSVETGERFTLGVPLGRNEGDPMVSDRDPIQHYMIRDRGHYEAGKDVPGGDRQSADDVLIMAVHGSTHVDALGHFWYGDQMYNGFDPVTTKGGLDKLSIEPIAERGVMGRGVLLDIARHRGVDHLEQNDHIPLQELKECADEQGVELQKHDILVIRTGWLERFYDGEQELIQEFDEPGITYSQELADWFHQMEIPAFATDTLANEQTHSEMGKKLPLHAAFMRDQGILFNEVNLLKGLAESCAEDEKYDFLYTCSPLKIVRGTGSPVNPLVVK